MAQARRKSASPTEAKGQKGLLIVTNPLLVQGASSGARLGFLALLSNHRCNYCNYFPSKTIIAIIFIRTIVPILIKLTELQYYWFLAKPERKIMTTISKTRITATIAKLPRLKHVLRRLAFK